jgi:hypothetical protein
MIKKINIIDSLNILFPELSMSVTLRNNKAKILYYIILKS